MNAETRSKRGRRGEAELFSLVSFSATLIPLGVSAFPRSPTPPSPCLLFNLILTTHDPQSTTLYHDSL